MDGATPHCDTPHAHTDSPCAPPDCLHAHTGSAWASLSRDELEAAITELAGQLNAAQYRWLMMIAEFDRREGWADGRLASCAHWLNFKVGLNLGAAREKVRVAHALGGVPKIAAAMACGSLSYSKVRALTRVASEATEDTLLMIALHGTAHHVERVTRSFRQACEAEALTREARQQAHRSLEYWHDEDGSLVLKARLPALTGALFLKALEAALEAVPATELNVELGEERDLSFAARRADALAELAERYLMHPADAATASEAPAGGPRGAVTADRYQVVVHVDAETLREAAPGRCQLEEGPALAVETVRRLSCDASLVRISEDTDGAALDVGRKRRTLPPAIRRALQSRDPGCCFPGCTHRRYLDAHHLRHWADGGATKLSNLISLCRTHHRLVHEGGIRVESLPKGAWRFCRPDGRVFEPAYRQGAPHYTAESLCAAHAAEHLAIDANTAATRWLGERMDYEWSVSLLCLQAGITPRTYPERPLPPLPPMSDVPAGTSDATVPADDLCRFWNGQTWIVVDE